MKANVVIMVLLMLSVTLLLLPTILSITFFVSIKIDTNHLNKLVTQTEATLRELRSDMLILQGTVLGYQRAVLALASKGKRVPLGTFNVTAYDPSGCAPSSNGYTSVGIPVGDGMIAANPATLPYGSVIYVYGEGISRYGIVGDTGGAMRQNPGLIDIYIPLNKDAITFGRKTLQVDLISFGD